MSELYVLRERTFESPAIWTTSRVPTADNPDILLRLRIVG